MVGWFQAQLASCFDHTSGNSLKIGSKKKMQPTEGCIPN